MWYVVRAYKNEAKAEAHLNACGLQTFVPRLWAIRTYHGAPHRVLVPAIPSILFVNAEREEIQQAKQTSPVTIQWLMPKHTGNDAGRPDPLTVRDSEMQQFIRVARDMEQDIKYFRPGEIDMARGSRVRIIGGPLDGVEGTLAHPLRKRSQRVYITLDGIATVATAPITPPLLQPL